MCVWFLLSSAKSRDETPSKVDSEVVPKVARMTVSGKKQTLGFDVPRYHNTTALNILALFFLF